MTLKSAKGGRSKRKKDRKAAIAWLKSNIFILVVAGEVFIPLWFFYCLKLYGETRFVLIYCQGAMVVLTSGILLWMIIDLILEVFRD